MRLRSTRELGLRSRVCENEIFRITAAILLYIHKIYGLLSMQFHQSKQLATFFIFVLVSLAIAYGPGAHLLKFAYDTGDQSYILLIPVLSAMLVYQDQKRVFSNVNPGVSNGAIVGLIAGVVFITLGYASADGSELQLAATAVGLVAFWVGAFIYCFGAASAKVALFPLGMLVWIVPIPALCINAITLFLQVGSTELVSVLFQLTGVPVLRDGFVFHLVGQSIEVAKACSGIRSSLSLIVLTLVIAHEFLLGNVRRFVLLASTIPIVILKNGIRIVTLTLLAIYVDPSFLTGSLHHDGGIVFFLLGLVMLIPILALLRRGETRMPPQEHSEHKSAAISV
jgi:exosortase